MTSVLDWVLLLMILTWGFAYVFSRRGPLRSTICGLLHLQVAILCWRHVWRIGVGVWRDSYEECHLEARRRAGV